MPDRNTEVGTLTATAGIVYVLNQGTGMVHEVVEGRSFERCNIDQIKRKVEIRPGDFAQFVALHACKRCFPDGNISHVPVL